MDYNYLSESYEKGFQFARDQGFRNFEVLQTGDFWSVMDYDQGKTYFESDGTMVESVIAFITGAGKPNINFAFFGCYSSAIILFPILQLPGNF